jgi:hypothetical protein
LKLVTIAWWRDFDQFVRESPVHCLAASMRAAGSREPLHLLVNDKGAMPETYLELLDSLGVTTICIEGMIEEIERGVPQLRFLPFFERACLLRWFVLDAFLQHQSSRTREVLVVDGDLIFLLAPEEISSAFSGRTFVLQGCPAFTFLSDPMEWITQYKRGLTNFLADIHGFSCHLSHEKESKLQWATDKFDLHGGWERNPLCSDQDLINALVANGLLRQDPIRDLQVKHRLAMCENPLGLVYQIIRTSAKPPITFRLIKGDNGALQFLANESRITHLHFQYDFLMYCSAVLALRSHPELSGRKPPHQGGKPRPFEAPAGTGILFQGPETQQARRI